MYVMQISRHTPESCPVFNDHYRKATVYLLERMDALMAKHGVKIMGMWNDHPGHLVYNIYETPNMETFIAFSMEPEMMAWLAFNTVEVKAVLGPQEIKTMFKLK